MKIIESTGTLIPYPFVLETERLRIQAPLVDDASQLRDAIEDSLDWLAPWMSWATGVPTMAECIENCNSAIEAFRVGSDYRFHLFLRESGEFVGGSGLHNPKYDVPSFGIGYWVRPSFSGIGLMTESVLGISQFAFEQLKANRLEISCSSRNMKSQRVAERAGFQLEGILKNDSRHLDGSLRDTMVFSRTPPNIICEAS